MAKQRDHLGPIRAPLPGAIIRRPAARPGESIDQEPRPEVHPSPPQEPGESPDRDADVSLPGGGTALPPACAAKADPEQRNLGRGRRADGCVTLPGYDIPILPASGVVQAAIFWSIAAERVKLAL